MNDHENATPSSPATGRVGAPAPLVTPVMIDSLERTKPWVMFFAVLGFICTAMMVLMGVLVAGAGLLGAVAGDEGGGFGVMMALGGLFYVAISALYFFGSLHLYRFATAIGRAAQEGQQLAGIEDALDHQRAFWRFTGISTVAVMGLYFVGVALMFVLGVAGAVFA